MLIKQKSLSLPRNLGFRTFGKLLIMFSAKVNLLYLLYLMAWRCRPLHLRKQNCLVKTFLRTLILMTHVFLYLFSLQELIWNCIIYLTLKVVEKVIMNPDLPKASGLDCILVVALKNYEPKNYENSSLRVWRSLLFQIVGRFHRWLLHLTMLGKGVDS